MKWNRAKPVLDQFPWARAAVWEIGVNASDEKPGYTSDDYIRDHVERCVGFMALRPWKDEIYEASTCELEAHMAHGKEQVKIEYESEIYLVYRLPKEPTDAFRWHKQNGTTRAMMKEVFKAHPGAILLGVILTASVNWSCYNESHEIYPVPEGWDPKEAGIIS